MSPDMGQSMFRAIPLTAFRPLRYCAARLSRRNPLRLACMLVLMRAARSYRGKLGSILFEVRPYDDIGLSFEPSDSMVIDSIYWFGIRGYEGTVPKTWASLCNMSESILEIGGNIGIFSVVGGVHARGDYVVVEPVPRNAQMLRRNLIRNRLYRVELHEAAAIPGCIPQDVQLNIPSEGRRQPVGAHLLAESEVSGRSSQELLTVRGIPMCELIKGRDLIKIDAEGIEYALLHSVKDYIIESAPSLIVEVLPESTKLGDLIRELIKLAGYKIYVLPEYGYDEIILVDGHAFDSNVPRLHNSKDILLTCQDLAGGART